MIRRGGALRRPLALFLIALVAAGAAILLSIKPRSDGPALQARAERPPLMLITSLPLIFGEEFGLAAGGSKALEALETRYRVMPIGITQASELRQAPMLLMAHPLAQPAEALVDLDHWVRSGGRVLILADPALAWPSERPLSDRLRPPPAYADTGLLAHWGLTLHAPDSAGPSNQEVDGRTIRSLSTGRLEANDDRCNLAADGLIARCAIGDGKATVIADADFLDADRIEGADPDANFALLLDELDRIAR